MNLSIFVRPEFCAFEAIPETVELVNFELQQCDLVLTFRVVVLELSDCADEVLMKKEEESKSC